MACTNTNKQTLEKLNNLLKKKSEEDKEDKEDKEVSVVFHLNKPRMFSCAQPIRTFKCLFEVGGPLGHCVGSRDEPAIRSASPKEEKLVCEDPADEDDLYA